MRGVTRTKGILYGHPEREQTKRGVSDDHGIAINLFDFPKAFICLHVREYISSAFPSELTTTVTAQASTHP